MLPVLGRSSSANAARHPRPLLLAALRPQSDANDRSLRHRKHKRRYRSRNCSNFRRYGRYFHLVQTKRSEASVVQDEAEDATSEQRQLTRNMLHLEAQIEQLLLQRDLAQSVFLNTQAHAVEQAMETTKKFYELFRYGYDPVGHPEASARAERFLRSVMAEDAVCTEFCGVDMFLQQYEMAVRDHAYFAVSLHGMRVVDGTDANSTTTVICAHGTARFRISRETIRHLFPSVQHEENLVQLLIGKEYVMQYDKAFHFYQGRIHQHESRVDLCSSLMDLVGDPALTMRLFQASMLTKHGHWKIGNAVQENRNIVDNATL